MRTVLRALLPAACALLCGSAAYAQRGVGDWTTSGFDAQRSHWVRTDAKISPESMAKPGFELDWKINLDDAAGARNMVTAPVLLDFYIGYRGFRSLGFLSNGSNTVAAIDTDLGRLEWKKNLGAAGAAGSGPCPGGMTSGVTRATNIAYQPAPTGIGTGRGNPAKSGVGEPFEGAVTLKTVRAAAPPPPKPPVVKTSSNRRIAEPPNPFAPRPQFVYALTSAGKLHAMYVSNGEEPKAGVAFLPPNANAQGLIVFDNQAYVSTAGSCGGVENGLWAMDIETQKVSTWKAPGNGVVGSVGPAVGPDGTLYAAAGGELFALEERTLTPKGSYNIGSQQFVSSPVVFDFKGRDFIAVAANDGTMHLIDAANLSKPLTKLSAGAGFAPQALASWQDTAGTRWLLASGPRSVIAWKVVEENGAVSLHTGWTSQQMTAPLTPIIVSGVVFAAAAGDNRTNAVLYALNAMTGKEMWNSGKSMTASIQNGGLAAGGSRIYVATRDGTQYVFGFPIEH